MFVGVLGFVEGGSARSQVASGYEYLFMITCSTVSVAKLDSILTIRGRTLSSPISSHIRDMRRGGRISNGIRSTGKVPLVKTSMVVGKAGANVVASVRNGFTLSTGRNSVVMVDCVNVGSTRIGIPTGKRVEIVLGRSSRLVSRIMIANCNSFGGTACAKSTSILGASGLRSLPIISMTRVVRTGVPKLDSMTDSSRPNSGTAIQIHKVTSVGTSARPLCMLSNIPMTSESVDNLDTGTDTKKLNLVRALGPTSVRDVAMLGSTTSTSLCKTGKSGNMVLVAAGGKGRNGVEIDVRTACNVASVTCGCHPVVKNRRHERLVCRKFIGCHLGRKSSRTRTGTCTSKRVSGCTTHPTGKCTS